MEDYLTTGKNHWKRFLVGVLFSFSILGLVFIDVIFLSIVDNIQNQSNPGEEIKDEIIEKVFGLIELSEWNFTTAETIIESYLINEVGLIFSNYLVQSFQNGRIIFHPEFLEWTTSLQLFTKIRSEYYSMVLEDLNSSIFQDEWTINREINNTIQISYEHVDDEFFRNLLSNITNGLLSDFSTSSEVANITETFQNEIDMLLVENTKIWEIDNLYNDSSYVRIEAYNSTLIFYYSKVNIISEENQFFVLVDPRSTTQVYKMQIDSLENFRSAVNALILIFL